MITKTRTRNSDLFELFDLDKLPKFSDIMKQKLIAMAKSGAKRPNSNKTKEGRSLSSYIKKSSSSYCPKFDKTIRKLRPDWFESTSQVMKQKLIAMAKSGAKRPSGRTTKEGQALTRYIMKLSDVYCPKFDETIHKLRPDWFIKSSDKNKQLLIEMAKSGAKRPSRRKTKEGSALFVYTSKSRNSYCPKFDKTIRKLRPDWFESTSQVMKQKLIAMAKSGAKRPSSKTTKEGRALCHYINKRHCCYCPKFDETIHKLRPDWFIKSSDKNKQPLIEMAKSGAKRPNSKTTKEGQALSNYINKSSSCYCPEFDKIIRKLAPSWFRKKRTLAK